MIYILFLAVTAVTRESSRRSARSMNLLRSQKVKIAIRNIEHIFKKCIEELNLIECVFCNP